MRYFIFIGFLVPVFALSGLTASPAADFSPGFRARKYFDSNKIVTIQGVVAEVKQSKHQDRRGYGLHLKVESEGKTYDVSLGPGWYFEDIGLVVKKGDDVELEGSHVKIDNEDALIATEIKIGDKSYQIRDTSGVPAWRGRGLR